MVIFRSQKGSASKKVWGTLLYSEVVAGACFQSFGFATVASGNCLAYMLMVVALNSDSESSLKEQMTK